MRRRWILFRIGIIGTGNMAEGIAWTLGKIKGMQCYAVASRSMERAQRFAEKFGLKKYFGSYEEMVKDDEIDMVYIATINICHKEQAILCIKYGKPCLVEKPFCLNVKAAEYVLNYARKEGVFIAEAMLIRYLPLLQFIRDNIKYIGEIKHIWGNICIDNTKTERVMNIELGGGALFDIGVYLLHFVDAVFEEKVDKININSVELINGVDVEENIFLSYESGKKANLHCSIKYSGNSDAVIYGTKGMIVVRDVYNFSSVNVYSGRKLVRKKKRKYKSNGYEYELIACADAVQKAKKECNLLSYDSILRIMDLTEKLRNKMLDYNM